MRLKSFTDLAAQFKPQVNVSEHAIKQYRAKLLQWRGRDELDEKIKQDLVRIVERGEVRRKLPGGLREYTYAGLSVAVDNEHAGRTVVTFLGDSTWRAWWRRQTKKRYARKVVNAL